MRPCFLLLMRHAKHDKTRVKGKPTGPTQLDSIASSLRELADKSGSRWWPHRREQFEFSDPSNEAVLTDHGRYETLAVAKRLGDFLSEGNERLGLAAVFHYTSDEATETAETFCKGFNPFLAAPDSLTPIATELLGIATRGQAEALMNKAGKADFKRQVLDEAAESGVTRQKNAVLFVGHQPAIGWLAEAFLDNPVPAAQSELLCLELNEPRAARLRWCISPAEETVMEELKEKIKSKMALANLLSGFITAGLGVLVAMLADKDKVHHLGSQGAVAFAAAACLGAAVALYLRTMFSYDRLVMPARFWADTASGAGNRPPWVVARPPSGAHWVLYQNMLRVWEHQFIPATFLTVFGLFTLWSAVLWSTWDLARSPEPADVILSRGLSLGLPVLVCLLAIYLKRTSLGQSLGRKLRRSTGPWLGSED